MKSLIIATQCSGQFTGRLWASTPWNWQISSFLQTSPHSWFSHFLPVSMLVSGMGNCPSYDMTLRCYWHHSKCQSNSLNSSVEFRIEWISLAYETITRRISTFFCALEIFIIITYFIITIIILQMKQKSLQTFIFITLKIYAIISQKSKNTNHNLSQCYN